MSLTAAFNAPHHWTHQLARKETQPWAEKETRNKLYECTLTNTTSKWNENISPTLTNLWAKKLFCVCRDDIVHYTDGGHCHCSRCTPVGFWSRSHSAKSIDFLLFSPEIASGELLKYHGIERFGLWGNWSSHHAVNSSTRGLLLFLRATVSDWMIINFFFEM